MTRLLFYFWLFLPMLKKVVMLFLLLTLPIQGEKRTNKRTRTSDKYQLIKDYNNQINSYRFSDPKKALSFGYKSLNLSVEMGPNQQIANTYDRMGNIFLDRGLFNLAMQYYKSAKNILLQTGNSITPVLINIGSVYYSIGMYDLAMEQYQKVVEQHHSGDNHIKQSALANCYIGMVFKVTGKLDSARFYNHHALELYSVINDSLGKAGALKNLGDIAFQDNKPDTALQFYYQAHEIYRVKQDQRNLAITLMAIGKIHEANGDIQSANTYFNDTAYLFKLTKNYADYIDVLLHLAGQKFDQKAYDAALAEVNQIIDLAQQYGLLIAQEAAYSLKADMYQDRNMFAEALLAYERHHTIHDSLYSKDLYQDIYKTELSAIASEHKFDINMKIAELNQSKHSRINIIIVAVVTVLFFALTSIFLYMRHKITGQLLRQEKQIYGMERERLNAQLERRVLELTSKAIQSVQQNELLEKLTGDIKKIVDEAEPETRNLVNQVLKAAHTQAGNGVAWQDFNNWFEKTSQTFNHILANKCPDLTAREMKICSLIKIGLNSKEIASIFQIEATSIDKSRYRIRKKLSIARSDNLENYLNNIS